MSHDVKLKYRLVLMKDGVEIVGRELSLYPSDPDGSSYSAGMRAREVVVDAFHHAGILSDGMVQRIKDTFKPKLNADEIEWTASGDNART